VISNDNWTLMTSHGVVLFHLARHPDTTLHAASDALHITERRIHQIVRELAADGLATQTKNGRRNHYVVNTEAFFRHPYLRKIPISAVLDVLPRE
jgi:hypothetical protein